MPKFIDLTGKVFGKWKVLEMLPERDNRGQIVWLCQCSCENKTIKTVKGGALSSGRSKNCGCERTRILIENNIKRKKYNLYEQIDEKTMIGYSSNDNKQFIFDTDEYLKIKDYCWWTNDYGYMYTTKPNSNHKKNLLLHHLILNFTDTSNGLFTDHINRNKLDNRKENLRIISRQNNARNISLSFDNTSGFIGVDWMKSESAWRSRIVYEGIAHHLGIFQDKEKAIAIRLQAELKYFGIEFAPQRHLFEEYNII